MKQLTLFQELVEQTSEPTPLIATEKDIKEIGELHYWKLYIDGASRNNPGPSGAGIYILKDDVPVEQSGFFLGTKTNNQAEYLALLLGLLVIKEKLGSNDMLLIISDSQLLVRQIEGRYKVKNPGIKQLHDIARILLHGISYDVAHVLRHENTQADALANLGVDKKKKIPQKFLTVLEHHGFLL